MLLVGRRKRRLSWIIRSESFCVVSIGGPSCSKTPVPEEVAHDEEIFRLSEHCEAELFARVSSLCVCHSATERQKFEFKGAHRQGSLDCITLGCHMYGELVFPGRLNWKIEIKIHTSHLTGSQGTIHTVVRRRWPWHFCCCVSGSPNSRTLYEAQPCPLLSALRGKSNDISAWICRTILVGFHWTLQS